MRDSPVSVSALLCKRNAVCVLCHLKYFYILPRGLFFGILRFRNIWLSEHWAVSPDQYLSNSVILFTTNLSFILSNEIWHCAREARVSLVLFSYLALKKNTNKYCQIRKQI